MRTTLTLDPDVEKLLREETHRLRKPFKQVVNDALRRGLSSVQRAVDTPPYRVTPHRTTLRAGIEATSLNRLADELEDEAIVQTLARDGRERG